MLNKQSFYINTSINVYEREAAVEAKEGCVPLCINIYEYIVCYIIMVGD